MTPASPDILIITRDFAVSHAATLAVPESWTETHESFSSALKAIGPSTRVLICDPSVDTPLAKLLPLLFVDQAPGRRAIVIQRPGAPMLASSDARITYLTWPVSLGTLADVIDGSVALEAALAA